MTEKRKNIGQRLVDGTKKHPVIVPLLVVILFLEIAFFFGFLGGFFKHLVSAVLTTSQHIQPPQGEGVTPK
ncbi:hypothetical protein [Acetobacter lambici]|uniref:Uncharacterized protein n=1 Tax=Acetobacter lambici TaxID=1332824 RepID=A0ABT1F362_9PROT|nr:hypothetical protein [Acetobacter lambici]MCP1243613.1 hypothetical protein [Acetobacter lambici]MCP1259639.1 hypothetical protein [Acetobacter lambici]